MTEDVLVTLLHKAVSEAGFSDVIKSKIGGNLSKLLYKNLLPLKTHCRSLCIFLRKGNSVDDTSLLANVNFVWIGNRLLFVVGVCTLV